MHSKPTRRPVGAPASPPLVTADRTNWFVRAAAVSSLSLLVALSVFTALAGRAQSAEPTVSFADAFGLKFDRPVVLTEIPGTSDQFLVVEQSGKIQRVFKDKQLWQKAEFASFKVLGGKRWEDERGLLGLAFHPQFTENRLYYVNFVSPRENTVVMERRVHPNLTKDSESQARVILEVEQPYGNHNGGTIAFGSDGYLYIGMGDGGSGGDPHNYAQDPESLLGKMLRLDVSPAEDDKAYAIPRDNPFVHNKKFRPEIWALGLRNPWKWTFHPRTGALWAADVGQGEFEEVSIIPRGGNMGWRRFEGTNCFESPDCNRKGMIMPLLELPRSEARSITGGEFYTGNKASRFNGAYIFGDYKTGTVWAMKRRSGKWERVKIGAVPDVSGFARDGRGDVYALGLKDGVVRKLTFHD